MNIALAGNQLDVLQQVRQLLTDRNVVDSHIERDRRYVRRQRPPRGDIRICEASAHAHLDLTELLWRALCDLDDRGLVH